MISVWQKLGCPSVVNGATLAAADLIAAVYQHSMNGGNLHDQLEMWNLKDVFFKDGLITVRDPGSSPERLEAERKCYDALRLMPEKERASAVALYEGYFLVPAYLHAAILNETINATCADEQNCMTCRIPPVKL